MSAYILPWEDRIKKERRRVSTDLSKRMLLQSMIIKHIKLSPHRVVGIYLEIDRTLYLLQINTVLPSLRSAVS